jgi:tetratricopeptide (TPR) repeat protein
MARNRVPFFAMTLGRYARFLDPDSPLTALTEAQGLAASEGDQEALKALNSVDPSGPYASIADESRISLLQRLGQSDEAARIALSAAQISASAADYVQLGDVLNQQGKYRDAAAAYDQALAASPVSRAPDDWGIWLLKGNALVQAGDWPAGEAALRKALSLAPDQPSILNLLGYALLERRQSIDEAKQLISRAAELKPEDAAITDSLGWAYYLSGDFERAVSTLETAALADENEPTIREHLGDAYWRNGQRVAARYAWQAALLLAEGEAAARLIEKADFGLTDKTEAR